nr:MAG TPA: hypothetical protein [Caudoviricetes sp.]
MQKSKVAPVQRCNGKEAEWKQLFQRQSLPQ